LSADEKNALRKQWAMRRLAIVIKKIKEKRKKIIEDKGKLFYYFNKLTKTKKMEEVIDNLPFC
jgi:hypothetical protein